MKVEGPSKSFLDDRAIGTTEPWLWEDFNRWRRELPDKNFFFNISFFRTFDSMIFPFLLGMYPFPGGYILGVAQFQLAGGLNEGFVWDSLLNL